MKLALAQVTSSTDPSANLELVRDHAGRAASGGAGLVVFPEATMHSFARSPRAAAEPADGQWATSVRAIAAEVGITIVVGMFTTGDAGRIRNTLLVTGEAEARYHKVHLFDALGHTESRTIEAGTRPVVFHLGPVTFGLATCYDVRFPGLFTELAKIGSEVILVPASWASGPGKVHQWRTLVTARAMDSTAFVVGCGQAVPPGKPDGKPTGVGHSLVADPYGTVLLELGDGPELAFVDLDLSLAAEARERMPVLRNARRFD